MMSFTFAVVALAALSGFAQGENCYCTEQYNPVCGSNGETFSNACMLRCHNINNHDNLTVASFDRCSHQQTLLAMPHFMKFNCFRLCPHTPLPVCGSDGVTYGSSCALDCVKKMSPSKKDVMKVSNGPCSKIQPQEEVEQEAKSDVCFCTDEFKPICGSDLHTYANMCSFECAAKKNHSLRLMNHGRCIIMP